MTKYVKGKDGKFAGSVGDGKTKVPTPAPAAPSKKDDVPEVPDHIAAQAEALRQHARELNEAAAESWERSDTDGFMSQWASGLGAQKARMEADLLEQGGVTEFGGIWYDADGNLVPARIITTRWGAKIAKFNSWDECLSNHGEVAMWYTFRGAKKAGLRAGTLRAPAKVDYVGSTAVNVHPVFLLKHEHRHHPDCGCEFLGPDADQD